MSLPEAREAKAEARRVPGFDGFPNFPALPNLGGQLLENFAGGATSIQRTNDEFTATHRTGGAKLTVKGKVDQGKAEVSSVTVEDAQGQKTTYESVEKVPAEYREKVRKLAEMSAKGAVRFPLD